MSGEDRIKIFDDKRISFWLSVVFSGLTVLFWGMLTHLEIKTTFQWVVLYYGTFFWGGWTGIAFGSWMAGYILFLLNEHLFLIAQIFDITLRFTPDQRYFAVWVLGGDIPEPEDPAIAKIHRVDPDLIPLTNDDGKFATVSARAVLKMKGGLIDDRLEPVRNIHFDRQVRRDAYKKLAELGAIEPGNPVEGPKVLKPALFEKYVKIAEDKVKGEV